MLAPIWRPAGRRTNVSGRQSRKYQTQKIQISSQVAIVSTERQFDSHYLEEHLDLDLKEQQRKGAGNKTNGYAKMPTHEQADHCRCLISTPKQQNNYSSFSRCGEKDILNTSLESAGSALDQSTICDNSLSRWELKAPFKSPFQIAVKMLSRPPWNSNSLSAPLISLAMLDGIGRQWNVWNVRWMGWLLWLRDPE